MRVMVPSMTWAPDWGDPKVVHLRESCDGEPRVITADIGEVGLAVCRAWLDSGAVSADDPRPRCDHCIETAHALGGIV